jgi:hypothetical protein
VVPLAAGMVNPGIMEIGFFKVVVFVAGPFLLVEGK